MIRKLVITLLSGALCLSVVIPALAVKYNEAPMLRVKVAAGELPPVDERLPEVPALVRDIAAENIDLEIGRYGGTMRMLPGNWPLWSEQMLLVPGLTFNLDELQGNILESFEASEDGMVFTFHMRKGLKWSDGFPVTTEDIRFWWEDFTLDKDITAAVPKPLTRGGEPLELEIVDDYTYRFIFKEAYGGFLSWYSSRYTHIYQVILPAHYMKQLHPRYTPLEEIEPRIKAMGYEKGEWLKLIVAQSLNIWYNKVEGPPNLIPWMVVESSPTQIIYERNPYYFKVDSAGNQLPYIDKIKEMIVVDAEAGMMKTLADEIDIGRGGAEVVPLILEHAKNTRVQWLSQVSSENINFNLTNLDPVWREVVRDPRFRKAVSHAINRQTIIETVYLGQAGFPTWIPSEYDPEKANRLLDEMGLDKRDEEGYRLGPDGKRFVVPFVVGWGTIPALEMDISDMEAVGIRTTMKTVDEVFRAELAEANELKATIGGFHPELWPFTIPDWQPVYWDSTRWWCPLWAQWLLSDGEKGEEPPAEVTRLYELYNLMMRTTDKTVFNQSWQEVEDLWYENVFNVLIVWPEKGPFWTSKNLGNVAHGGTVMGATYNGEQMFFRE